VVEGVEIISRQSQGRGHVEGVEGPAAQGRRVASGEFACSRPSLGGEVLPLPYAGLYVVEEVLLERLSSTDRPTSRASRNSENDAREFSFTEGSDQEDWTVLFKQRNGGE
jgi:hypothetical protein